MKEETRQFVFQRDGYRCRQCGKPAKQIAHRIARTKVWLRRYGVKVLDHPRNLLAVCSLACNDACNIGNKPEEREALAGRIKEVLEHEHI